MAMVKLGSARGYLYRLLKYAPRKNRTPREDFFTEALAGYLRVFPDALDAIVKVGRESGKLALGQGYKGGPLEFKTQRCWRKYGRPDIIVYSGEQPVLVIECKIGASFTETSSRIQEDEAEGEDLPAGVKQIPKYCAKILKEGWGAKVVVVSQVPRDAEVVNELEEEYRNIYIGNLLWSDVHKALCAARGAETTVDSVLAELLIDLMEDMGMKERNPLTAGSVEPYYAYRETLATMGLLLDEVAHELMKRFDCRSLGGTNSSWYVWRNLSFGEDVCLGLYLEFDDAGERVPIWPMLYVEPDCANTAGVLHHLEYEEHDPKWEGKVVYSGSEEALEMLRASSWQEQVVAATSIFRVWLDHLAGQGQIRRRSP